jgi:CRISPR-associated exonuclease Cas4
MDYPEDDLIPLSGLQHYAFCRRQWALGFVEGQWQDNVYTVEGALLHERAHDPEASELRYDVLTVRGLPVVSYRLGLRGVCDVVEFLASPAGVPLAGRPGTWLPRPVEYKRGAPKGADADRLQLCAQALCLEDMLCCPPIPEAGLFYGQTRRRETVALTPVLRDKVARYASEMHDLARHGHTPKVKPTRACNACSLRDLCLPKLYERTGSARPYVARRLEEQP